MGGFSLFRQKEFSNRLVCPLVTSRDGSKYIGKNHTATRRANCPTVPRAETLGMALDVGGRTRSE